nr:uncharacterized protein LOC117996428 [Maniola hyperantus]
MEELKEILKQIQKDMTEQKRDMDKMKEDIIEQIQQTNKAVNEKFDKMESKTLELENRLDEQQLLIEKLENQLRRKNVLFFGVQETEKNYKELEQKILSIIKENMDLPYTCIDIDSIRRLGKKGTKARPVAVSMSTLGRKIELLKNKHKLAETSMYIKEEFSQRTLQKRRDLQEELRTRREQGEKVTLRYDKIITVNKRGSSPEKRRGNVLRDNDRASNSHTRNNKRKPESPPTTLQIQHHNRASTSQSVKKNRTTIDLYYSKKQTDSLNGPNHDS